MVIPSHGNPAKYLVVNAPLNESKQPIKKGRFFVGAVGEIALNL